VLSFPGVECDFPGNGRNINTTTTQIDSAVKMRGTITIVDPVLPERGRSSNILALVLIVIIVAVSIVIAIVVHMMIEFCGGCWLRPFSEDLGPVYL